MEVQLSKFKLCNIRFGQRLERRQSFERRFWEWRTDPLRGRLDCSSPWPSPPWRSWTPSSTVTCRTWPRVWASGLTWGYEASGGWGRTSGLYETRWEGTEREFQRLRLLSRPWGGRFGSQKGPTNSAKPTGSHSFHLMLRLTFLGTHKDTDSKRVCLVSFYWKYSVILIPGHQLGNAGPES